MVTFLMNIHPEFIATLCMTITFEMTFNCYAERAEKANEENILLICLLRNGNYSKV